MKVIASAVALAFTAVSLSGCGGGDDDTTTTGNATTTGATTGVTTTAATSTAAPGDQNIVELALANEDLTTLVAAVKAGELVDTLEGEGPFTVFAPTNAAFDHLPNGTVDTLLKPENIADLQDLLKYHVVSGAVTSSELKDGQTSATVEGKHNLTFTIEKEVKVNFAVVTNADVMASNGVVHLIDSVLLPYDNIVEKASATDSLSTLVSAVSAVDDVAQALQGPGPFTVLAPTNEAFAALPAGTVDNLLKPENKDELTNILTYHVLQSFTLSKDLNDGDTPVTLQGKPVTVTIGEKVKFNDATVTQADVLAMNGVVHIIDGVLMPPSYKAIEV